MQLTTNQHQPLASYVIISDRDNLPPFQNQSKVNGRGENESQRQRMNKGESVLTSSITLLCGGK